MLRLSSVAAGVSLIAFSTLAFAGADNTTNEGSAFSPTASEGGLKSEPSISTARAAVGSGRSAWAPQRQRPKRSAIHDPADLA
jgi:hypothetical protein